MIWSHDIIIFNITIGFGIICKYYRANRELICLIISSTIILFTFPQYYYVLPYQSKPYKSTAMKTQVLPDKMITDAEKALIISEIRDVVNAMFNACELADLDGATKHWLDTPDMLFIFNGTIMDFKGVGNAMGPVFDSLLNQEVKIIDEKYTFLDRSIVIYTTNCTFLENYKDGHSAHSDPMIVQFVFVKDADHWKVINAVESSVRQDLP
jgi:hypothetical protein